MEQSQSIISVTSLKKSFKNLNVLKGVSFKVDKGSIFALLGSNGAGKTTTINILSTLLKPDGGMASICGFDVVQQADKVRECISLTGQYAAVDEVLTARENLRMIGSLRHIQGINKKTDELLAAFRLENAADRRVSTYSGGMRRRLDIAMSLMGNPPIIFLDEPTTGLDPQSRLAMWNIVKSMANAGTTVFLTTQYLEEAEYLADYIAILHEGIIVADGAPDTLKETLPTETVELSFHNDVNMQKARGVLKGYRMSQDEKALNVSVFTDGSVEQFADILNRLSNTGIPISKFVQKQPTLEDVFLTLIGENKEGKKQ